MKGKIAFTSVALVIVLAAGWAAHAEDAKTPYPNMAPLDWLRAHDVYFDSAWFDASALRGAIDRFGADRFLFGTDGSAHGHSIGFFCDQLGEVGLSEGDLQLVQSGNAERLFGVG